MIQLNLILVLVKILLLEVSILIFLGIASFYPPYFRLTIFMVGILVFLILAMTWSSNQWYFQHITKPIMKWWFGTW